MSPPSAKASAEAVSPVRVFKLSPELEQELRESVAEIERGEHIELTPTQLDAWGKTGEFPWPDELHG